MDQLGNAIEHFFRAFEVNNATGNVAEIVAMFADVFMAASPQGTQAVRGSDFALALPKRKQLFESLGSRSTELVSLEEERLDARYVLARTQWRMRFARGEGDTKDVVVDSVYIVDTGAETLRIVFYLANQDIMQVLKERGIVAAD
jgi:hypothetical protein